MPGEARTAAEIERDQAKIAKLYLQGWSQVDIARELKRTTAMVSRDLAAIRKGWVASALLDFNEAKARELERLDQIEREAWSAYRKSKKKLTSTEITAVEGGNKKVRRKEEERTGNPQYLQIALRCSEQRAKLLGLVVDRVDMTSGGKSLSESMAGFFNKIGQMEKDGRKRKD